MSYNTRRSGGNFGVNSANSIGNIGQRRPQPQSLSNNFIPGGQLSQGNKQQQQYHQQKPAQQPPLPQQQQQFRQQPPPQPQSQAPPPPQLKQQPTPPPQVKQQPTPPPQVKQQPTPPPQVKQQPTPPPIQTPQPTPPPPQVTPTIKEDPGSVEETTNGDESTTGSTIKKRPFWMRRPPGKISKKERLRRRNLRLRKILQPKNALMVLNELAGNVVYNMTEIVGGLEPPLCKASVLVDGIEHVGVGKSKVMAKQNAAECAIKHLVLSKLRADAANVVKVMKVEESSTNNSTSTGENVPSTTTTMDTTEEGNTNTETDVSWSHVASYALHKLLTAWDEGDNLTERIAQATASIPPMVPPPVTGPDGVWKPMSGPVEKRPAKKLPENAALMNPVMLLNQMRPNAVYEEVTKTGTPPHVMFTIKCTTDNQSFFGTGKQFILLFHCEELFLT
ncbi:double-stranded RNA-specific editase 1 [Agrilus planipennis]|uniref:Double-stranded RNA-specific editase 1 n=1 Tax=Agrilus planipennis TaxID=224129 RepID=A0A1W4WDY7_AGRPL|nr:double-stranded RNA-specific editase 1 [Agrilus planipennis]